MAFPVVGSVGSSIEATAVTTHDVVVPVLIVSGDLLLMFTSLDTAPTLSGMPAGWVLLTRQVNGSIVVSEVWYKIAVGGEGNFTYTSSVGRESVTHVLRITVATWHGTTVPEIVSTFGATANPDPPDLNPAGWGTEDTLWIAYHGSDNGRTTSAFPTSYDDNQFSQRSNPPGASCNQGLATRALNAASENPGAFTINLADQWTGITVAVRPGLVTPSLLWASQPLHALIGR